MMPVTRPSRPARAQLPARVAARSTHVSSYLDYWGTRVTASTCSPPHRRADAHRQQPRRGARRARCRARRADLGGARATAGAPIETSSSSPDRGRTRPPAERRRARRASRRRRRDRPRDAAHAICDAVGEPSSTCPGSTGVHTTAPRGVGRAQGRLPGHRAPHPRAAARGRHPGALRVAATCTPEPTPRSARPSRASRTPGSSGSRGLARLRPDQRHRDRRPPRARRPRPRLRRRAAAARRVRRSLQEPPAREGDHHARDLIVRRGDQPGRGF